MRTEWGVEGTEWMDEKGFDPLKSDADQAGEVGLQRQTFRRANDYNFDLFGYDLVGGSGRWLDADKIIAALETLPSPIPRKSSRKADSEKTRVRKTLLKVDHSPAQSRPTPLLKVDHSPAQSRPTTKTLTETLKTETISKDSSALSLPTCVSSPVSRDWKKDCSE